MAEARTHDIVAKRLNKSFNGNHVLRELDLEVERGETFVLLGLSGSGKSVFLKHIAGLIVPDSGTIEVLGSNIHELPPDQLLELRRHVGMVFQSAALFNSMTVEENVALALREYNQHTEDDIRDIVNEKLKLVSMTDSHHLLPEEISGGMKKRVAVARALALDPKIILFDEPTTGLDPIMSRNVDELILDLKKQVKVTSVVVSHDLATAFLVGDRVGMIHEGRIIGVGTPDEFRASDNEIIRRFIGADIHGMQKDE